MNNRRFRNLKTLVTNAVAKQKLFNSSYVKVTWEVTPYDWGNGPGHAKTSVETEICLKEIAPHVGYERGFDRGQTHRIVTAVETL